jgi:hypothetical protein
VVQQVHERIRMFISHGHELQAIRGISVAVFIHA